MAAYESAFGERPQRMLRRREPIDAIALERFLDAWATPAPQVPAPEPAPGSLHPLISHHAFNAHRIFAEGSGSAALARNALTSLLAYDGLVIADPIHELVKLRSSKGVDAAVNWFRDITEGIGTLEPLLERDIVRFTSFRPGFTERVRSGVFEAFGVGPEFTAFTDLVEAASTADVLGAAGRKHYLDEVRELFARYGVVRSARDVDGALQDVHALARALIHISWAVSVCTADAGADLALLGPLEEHLFAGLVDEHIVAAERLQESSEQVRPYERVASSRFPNVDNLDLTIADALAIRSEDSFAGFRDGMRTALRRLDAAERSPDQSRVAAEEDFRLAMRELARTLGARAPRSAVADRIREGSVDVGIAAVTAVLPVLGGLISKDAATMLSAAAIPLSVLPVLTEWLAQRRGDNASRIAVRYATTLGAPPPRRRQIED